MEKKAYLSVENLTVKYITSDETVNAVNNVSFSLEKGKTLGLVGETGAGKTTIARAILRILQSPPGEITEGKIYINGKNLLELSEKEMYQVRGNQVSMIFQDPMTALNPVITVGKQISEVIRYHEKVSKKEARERAAKMLEMVGIPAERFDEYPHQFSGGMKQRVVIAIALACSPDLLLADEPTTALDVTIQAQVLELIRGLQKSNNTTMILITHDLGVVAEMCEQVAIIYAGEIVEMGDVLEIYENPRHPYTIGLFRAIPTLEDDKEKLEPIPGMMTDPTNLPKGCKFHPRCKFATEECSCREMELKEISAGHFCRCAHVQGEKT
ncbi:MAG: ABC transporter ATP-binding protein [Lachnospiraceae bacterium]|nr:ABC transporter ATP-binding protein [Lachnospiraceae bacterium]